jgi:hypothetical protein
MNDVRDGRLRIGTVAWMGVGVGWVHGWYCWCCWGLLNGVEGWLLVGAGDGILSAMLAVSRWNITRRRSARACLGIIRCYRWWPKYNLSTREGM